MLRQGPLSLAIHGVLEYVAAVALIVAPFALSFSSGAATAVSIVAGVAVLVMAATTAGPTSLIDSLPVSAHILLDYALAALLVAAPFLFGFTGESPPTAFFIVLGLAHLLITIATRFRPATGHNED
ncbi:MAG TPA: hypothetical protein VGN69_03645 [Solirubrobacteraceae bacterium]|jgi:hypothetical protein|nr:hypothetical protein [Solirubrobacteraceae bacterium]